VRQAEFDAAIGVLARGFATSEHVPLLRRRSPPTWVSRTRVAGASSKDSRISTRRSKARQDGALQPLPLLLVKCGEIHLLAGERDEALRLASRALQLATEQKERGNKVYATHLLAEIASQRDGATRRERSAITSMRWRWRPSSGCGRFRAQSRRTCAPLCGSGKRECGRALDQRLVHVSRNGDVVLGRALERAE
jgi:hypothetical protein